MQRHQCLAAVPPNRMKLAIALRLPDRRVTLHFERPISAGESTQQTETGCCRIIRNPRDTRRVHDVCTRYRHTARHSSVPGKVGACHSSVWCTWSAHHVNEDGRIFLDFPLSLLQNKWALASETSSADKIRAAWRSSEPPGSVGICHSPRRSREKHSLQNLMIGDVRPSSAVRD